MLSITPWSGGASIFPGFLMSIFISGISTHIWNQRTVEVSVNCALQTRLYLERKLNVTNFKFFQELYFNRTIYFMSLYFISRKRLCSDIYYVNFTPISLKAFSSPTHMSLVQTLTTYLMRCEEYWTRDLCSKSITLKKISFLDYSFSIIKQFSGSQVEDLSCAVLSNNKG